MSCGCNHIKIRHIQGNVLRISVPLTLRTIEVEDGVLTTTDTDFYPSANYPVAVEFSNQAQHIKLLSSLNGSTVVLEDQGTIPVGTYSITISCKDAVGNPYRFKQRQVLQVVDVTCEGDVDANADVDVVTNYLDAALFFASGVAGKGILRISATEGDHSTALTFQYVDGTSDTFNIISGVEQVVDQAWDTTSSRAIANREVSVWRNDVIAELSERSSVSEEILDMKW